MGPESEIVFINLDGSLDQPQLKAVRSALGLRREGRFEDVEDQIMGSREYLEAGQELQVTLSRYDVEGPWHISLIADPGFPSAIADRIEQEYMSLLAGLGIGAKRASR